MQFIQWWTWKCFRTFPRFLMQLHRHLWLQFRLSWGYRPSSPGISTNSSLFTLTNLSVWTLPVVWMSPKVQHQSWCAPKIDHMSWVSCPTVQGTQSRAHSCNLHTSAFSNLTSKKKICTYAPHFPPVAQQYRLCKRKQNLKPDTKVRKIVKLWGRTINSINPTHQTNP